MAIIEDRELCRFCGSEAKVSSTDSGGDVQTRCFGCGRPWSPNDKPRGANVRISLGKHDPNEPHEPTRAEKLYHSITNEPKSDRERLGLFPPGFSAMFDLLEDEEAVDHPAHYGGADNPYEVIKVIEAWGLNFNLGTLVRYIYRAGKKDPKKHVEDLKKARWYLDREISNLEQTEL